MPRILVASDMFFAAVRESGIGTRLTPRPASSNGGFRIRKAGLATWAAYFASNTLAIISAVIPPAATLAENGSRPGPRLNPITFG